MPNGKVHTFVGAGSGAALTIYCGRSHEPGVRFIEAVGGGLGGYLGGKLPDMLEPAVSPWHRDLAHSWATGTAVVAALPRLKPWEQYCRQRAAQYGALRSSPGVDPLTRFLHGLLELFWRLAAGFASGLAAGYASHLALDAFTPSGLPLFVR